ncbi:ABC transporter permease [Paenibacillus sp. WST5]|uniref:Transport permease protein n=2 Tax=Paenibacillus sedimenti TaxID=2770274 RepID=A0A926KNX3_9BACL|nr:ABC transporter permease [Paenibacillus sedimenti]
MREKLLLFNPIHIFLQLFKKKELILQFAKRDLLARYKGSYLGILWSFINPLLMLVIYTFVFSEVFKSKWSSGTESKVEFALLLFCGLNAFNIFAEVIGRAPGLILNHTNYVKKVVFPLEILPVTILLSALMQSSINFLILISALVLLMHTLQWTALFLPLVLLPLVLLTLGLGWFFSSLGVFMRDITQFVGTAISALMLLSPIFYPVSIVPEQLKILYYINPFGYVIEDVRRILVWGQMPQWSWLASGMFIGLLFFVCGYAWFEKTRKGFSDVL